MKYGGSVLDERHVWINTVFSAVVWWNTFMNLGGGKFLKWVVCLNKRENQSCLNEVFKATVVIPPHILAFPKV